MRVADGADLAVLPAYGWQSGVWHCELIDHGRNGFLADQDDIRGLADSVLTLYRDEALRQRITRQAQQDVFRYDTAHVLEQLAAIYEKHGAQA